MKHKIFLTSLLFFFLYINYITEEIIVKTRTLFMYENEKMTLAFIDHAFQNVDFNFLNIINIKKKVRYKGENLSTSSLKSFNCLDFISNYEIYNKKFKHYKHQQKIHYLDKNIEYDYVVKNRLKETTEQILKNLSLLARENKNSIYTFCTENNQIINFFVFKRNSFANFVTQITM